MDCLAEAAPFFFLTPCAARTPPGICGIGYRIGPMPSCSASCAMRCFTHSGNSAIASALGPAGGAGFMCDGRTARKLGLMTGASTTWTGRPDGP